MVRAIAAISALALPPALVTAAPNAAPLARPTAAPAVPCGFVAFSPAGAPRIVNGTAYERIKAIVRFSDGHTETPEFPYAWVYPNAEQTDPWSWTNLHRLDVSFAMQLPPAASDVKTFPAILQYVIAHITADGFIGLPPCAPPVTLAASSGGVPAFPTGTEAVAWLPFFDDTPRDAPIAIIDAAMDARVTSSRDAASVVRACVTFWNRSRQRVAAIRFTFSSFDAAGNPKTIQPLDRFGSFAPGALVEGIRRGDVPWRANTEARKNCRMFAWSGDPGVNRVAVTAVEFADGSTWPRGSAAIWSTPLP